MLVSSILNAFNGMLLQLPWIDKEKTLPEAERKISDLQKNYAFPDFIVNDTRLDAYYEKMALLDTDSYFDMREKLDDFNFQLLYKTLPGNDPVDRKDFLGPPGTVNAWYQV